jgi:hypothetical protein
MHAAGVRVRRLQPMCPAELASIALSHLGADGPLSDVVETGVGARASDS